MAAATPDHLMVTTYSISENHAFCPFPECAKPLPHPPAEISSWAQSPQREKGGYAVSQCSLCWTEKYLTAAPWFTVQTDTLTHFFYEVYDLKWVKSEDWWRTSPAAPHLPIDWISCTETALAQELVGCWHTNFHACRQWKKGPITAQAYPIPQIFL